MRRIMRKLLRKMKRNMLYRIVRQKIYKVLKKKTEIYINKYKSSSNHYKLIEFAAEYEPDKDVYILWQIPKDYHFFFKNFFENHQVVFINKPKEFINLKRIINIKEAQTTLFSLLQKKSRLQALSFSKKFGIKIDYLKPGFIGHPLKNSLSACFFDKLSDNNGNYSMGKLIATIAHSQLSPILQDQGVKLRVLYKALKIGASCLPSFIVTEKFLGPKITKRVLILPHNASPNGLKKTEANLVKLAISENPKADIFVYIHKSRPTYKLIYKDIKIGEKTCRYAVVSRVISTTDMILACDQIYTDHSMKAVDAIFYDKKLTVVGKPFYSGWGLTDDRSVKPRKRKLTVDEFFSIIFLKCTRYCYDDQDSATGLLATMFDVAGSYSQAKLNSISKKELDNPSSLLHLCNSEYWPNVFDLWASGGRVGLNLVIQNNLSLTTIYPKGTSANYTIAAAIIGSTINSPYFVGAIRALKDKIPVNDIIAMLLKYCNLTGSYEALKEVAQLFGANNELEKSYNAWEKLKQLTNDKQVNENETQEIKESSFSDDYEIEFNMAKILARQHKYSESEALFYTLLLKGYVKKEVFAQLANIFKSTFRFKDAIILYELTLKWVNQNGRPTSISHSNLFYILDDGIQFINSLCLAIKTEPVRLTQYLLNKDLLDEKFGDNLKYDRAFYNASKQNLRLDKKTEQDYLSMAKACMIYEQPEQMLDILNRVKNPHQKINNYLCQVTAYMQNGTYSRAKEIIDALLIYSPQLKVYQEAIKLSILKNDYEWAKQLFENAEVNNFQKDGIPVDALLYRKFLFATDRPQEAFESFRLNPLVPLIKDCFGEKYIQHSVLATGPKILILAYYGPGDEIRFASLYSQISKLFPNKKVAFSCDPRLIELFAKSYSEFEFFPISRQRILSNKLNTEEFNQLPSFGLQIFLDSAGWKLTSEFQNISLVIDLLGEVVKDKNSISGRSFLTAHPNKIDFWSRRIQSPRIKIGLSWRSSVVSCARSEHYLSIQDLKPLLDLFDENLVEFFNLQYDDATKELDWVATNCRHQITNFPDLDQYNDLSSVAALMSCLDLVISPATTVIELAGALGCSSFLLSNSSELFWRKSNHVTKTDIWYKNVTHVEGDKPGDKSSLVMNLVEAVRSFVEERTPKDLLRENCYSKLEVRV
jgi:capsular polysaccharide export protein